MNDTIATIDIEHLDVDSIHVQPMDIDWRNTYGPNGEGWVVIPPGDLQCQNGACMAVFNDQDDCPLCEGTGDADENQPEGSVCPSCQGEGKIAENNICPTCGDDDGLLKEYDVVEAGDEPMMSYYYPVPGFNGGTRQREQGAARALHEAGVSLCLVEFNSEEGGPCDGFALALTGGGMDLSWDICAAFMAIGYSPPVKYTDLPRFAGQDNTKPRYANIIKACIRSNDIARMWAEGNIKRLKALTPDPDLVCDKPGCEGVPFETIFELDRHRGKHDDGGD